MTPSNPFPWTSPDPRVTKSPPPYDHDSRASVIEREDLLRRKRVGLCLKARDRIRLAALMKRAHPPLYDSTPEPAA